MASVQKHVNVLIIANKTWEAEPLLHVFLERRARPGTLKMISQGYCQPQPGDQQPAKPGARATARCEVFSSFWQEQEGGKKELTAALTSADIQVWCIEDWMPANVSSSSTPSKWTVLARMFANGMGDFTGAKPDLVVAFGTAGIPSTVAFNGCVAIGSRTFCHDPFGGDPEEKRRIPRKDGSFEAMWTDARLDTVMHSSLAPDPGHDRLAAIANDPRHSAALDAAEARFVAEPDRPSQAPLILLNNGFAAVSTVNVFDYADYVWADPQSVQALAGKSRQCEVGSAETTHGLIRLAAADALGLEPLPFLYVSGITDSVGLFDMDVSPRVYAQNFAAAHNAGLALAWLLPELICLL